MPESIFGKELREKADQGEAKKGPRTDFLRSYSHDELGEKLRKLRPEVADKSTKEWFSLTELNERLAKLREAEEKESEMRLGGLSFRDLRDSLASISKSVAKKNSNSKTFFDLFALRFSSLSHCKYIITCIHI